MTCIVCVYCSHSILMCSIYFLILCRSDVVLNKYTLTICVMTGMADSNTCNTNTFTFTTATHHHHQHRRRQSIVFKWRLNLNEPLLIISLTPTGTLCPNLNYTSTIRGKSCYFIKKQPQALNIDDIHSVCIIVQIKSVQIQFIFVYTVHCTVQTQRVVHMCVLLLCHFQH